MAKPAPLAVAVAAARKQKGDAVLPALLQVCATWRPPALAALIEAVSEHLHPTLATVPVSDSSDPDEIGAIIPTKVLHVLPWNRSEAFIISNMARFHPDRWIG